MKGLGEKQRLLDCAAYDSCPADYCSGKTSFTNRKYYNRRAVKDLLIKMHNWKCCYCENRFRYRADLHVEHFRPRSGVRQTHFQKNDELPGYYWLAYDWENLLLSCGACNCTYKRTLFPLANPKKRARSHRDDVTKERPLFVNPVAQEPRRHIRFDRDLPRGITSRGRMTIDGIGLRRSELTEARLELLKQIDTAYVFLNCPTNAFRAELRAKAAELQAEAREFIDAAVKPDAQFSSMAKDYVESLVL